MVEYTVRHVVPFDSFRHDTKGYCECRPRIDSDGTSLIIYHQIYENKDIKKQEQIKIKEQEREGILDKTRQ